MVKRVFKPIGFPKPTEKLPSRLDFINWLIVNGKFVSDFKAVTDNFGDFFTVPSGKTRFVLSAVMQWVTRTTGGFTLNADVTMDIAGKRVIFQSATATHLAHEIVSVSFSIPLKMNAGEFVRVDAGSQSTYVFATVTGYEIDNEKLKELTP